MHGGTTVVGGIQEEGAEAAPDGGGRQSMTGGRLRAVLQGESAIVKPSRHLDLCVPVLTVQRSGGAGGETVGRTTVNADLGQSAGGTANGLWQPTDGHLGLGQQGATERELHQTQ